MNNFFVHIFCLNKCVSLTLSNKIVWVYQREYPVRKKNRNHCRHPMMPCWCYNTGTVITPQNDTNHSDWCHYSFGVIRLNRHNSLKDVHYRRRRLGLKDPNLKNEKVLPLQNDCRWSKGRSKRGRGWLTDKSNCSHLPCYFSSWLYPKLTATTTTPLPKQNAI